MLSSAIQVLVIQVDLIFIEPIISSIVTANIKNTDGGTLNITGDNFGYNASRVTVQVGTAGCSIDYINKNVVCSRDIMSI
jgi:hypothetical protein